MKSEKYDKALNELQELVKQIEAPDKSLEDVKKELESGLKLIETCRKELRDYQQEINEILDKN